MAKIDRVQEVSLDLLRPYPNNAKIHSEDQVNRIAESIEEFGFLSPCLIDKDYNIIAGHGRVMAAKKLGMESVPCVFIEGLTDAQRRAYILADNRLTELGEWDQDILSGELEDLLEMDFDAELTGFDFDIDNTEWFEKRERFDDSRQEGNDEYNDFLDKFELKKTTDDCYTPDNIYEDVANYVAKRFNRDRKDFVRPFYPGGDYQHEKYKKTDVVVDNPPFSILSEIVGFYMDNSIDFFLFAPTLTVATYSAKGVTVMPMNASITYENGAKVPTGFLTNMVGDGIILDNDPQLREQIEKTNKENEALLHRNLPKYQYPYDVLTSARASWLAVYGQRLILRKDECVVIDALDAQKEMGKAIYGRGYLLSKRAAAERAAAERAAAERAAAERAAAERAAALCFELSDREKKIQEGLR